MQPSCGMYCIQGTVTQKTKKNAEVTRQFATFYLHPEVNASSVESAIRVAEGILNRTEDPNITVNASALLVSVASVATVYPNIKIWIGKYFIEISEGALTTNLHEITDKTNSYMNPYIDGICSMVLEAHKQGIDVNVTPFLKAIESAVNLLPSDEVS